MYLLYRFQFGKQLKKCCLCIHLLHIENALLENALAMIDDLYWTKLKSNKFMFMVATPIKCLNRLRGLTHTHKIDSTLRHRRNDSNNARAVDAGIIHLDPNIVLHNIHTTDDPDVMYYRDHLYADALPTVPSYMLDARMRISARQCGIFICTNGIVRFWSVYWWFKISIADWFTYLQMFEAYVTIKELVCLTQMLFKVGISCKWFYLTSINTITQEDKSICIQIQANRLNMRQENK